MNRTLAFLSLFTSLSTLFCCALPSLFVLLGFGSAFAGLVTNFPRLIWLSENKLWIFGIGGLFLLAVAVMRKFALSSTQKIDCPPDKALNEACSTARDWTGVVFVISTGFYLLGAFFAFIAQRII